MSNRSFSKSPQLKAEDYHGSCMIARIPKVFQAGGDGAMPKSLNLHISFEDALKLSVAIQSCVMAMNRYKRSTSHAKKLAMCLSIKFDEQQIAVLEEAMAKTG
jgi:hypothetical protein